VGRLLNLVAAVREATPGHRRAGKELVDAVIEDAEARRRLEDSRVEMMRGYAETRRCRWDFLLAYFGDDSSQLCGHCDNCEHGFAVEEQAQPARTSYVLQERVAHPEFGPGLVMDLEDDRITVLFDEVGYRTLSLEVVERDGLLTGGDRAS
jgi:ATP-dependent DNA helicase RecQ